MNLFFYGAKPQTEAQRSEDGVARLHLTAVRLRGAIWRLTRLRRSTAEPKCRMSEYDGSEVKRLIQVHLKINVHISIFLWGEAPNVGVVKRSRSCTDSLDGSNVKNRLIRKLFILKPFGD